MSYFYTKSKREVKEKKEVTIYDIADKLGVSTATVSRALQNNPSTSLSTRKKINALAESMGYRPNLFASSLRSQKTHTIGVILHELNSSFITSVLAGIEKIASEAKYNLIIVHSAESVMLEKVNVLNLFNKRVDGIIASLSFDTENLSHFEQFKNKNIPVVFFDRVFEKGDDAKVIINNFQAGYDATAHLIEQGCKRIAIVTSSLKRNVYSERTRGYKQALVDHHMKFDEKLLIVDGLREEDAIRSAKHILSMKTLPDGIFITNDFCAAVIMQSLKDAGIQIPRDIAIVGFNNDNIGKVVSPKLTTVNYPGFEMGKVAAHNLINHLKGIWDLSLSSTVVIKSELIIRESSLKNASTGKK